MRSYLTDRAVVQNPANPCPQELFEQIVAIPVRFVRFAGGIGEGTIEVHRDLAADVEALFQFMVAEQFPLSVVLPIACLKWDDECSMAANNTSGFNYRTIAGEERLSNHALGRAIDINPMFNPCIRGEIIQPAGASYDPLCPGTLTAESRVIKFLKARGFAWGGDWTCGRDGTPLKDYQHFEKMK